MQHFQLVYIILLVLQEKIVKVVNCNKLSAIFLVKQWQVQNCPGFSFISVFLL